jgi:hypothetical protein
MTAKKERSLTVESLWHHSRNETSRSSSNHSSSVAVVKTYRGEARSNRFR